MEANSQTYEAGNCTVTVERVYEEQKPIKELLLELLKEQVAACLQA